jgi:hypothetical protein
MLWRTPLTEVNRAREEEIRSLKIKIHAIHAEIREINKRERGIFGFLTWLFTGFPEVLRLYKAIRRVKAESKSRVTEIDADLRSVKTEIDNRIKQLMEKYPSELKEIAAAISQNAANTGALSTSERRKLAAQIKQLSRN